MGTEITTTSEVTRKGIDKSILTKITISRDQCS